MGNCTITDRAGGSSGVSPGLYIFQNIIGRGGFGEVWKAINVMDKKIYAVKVMNKTKIVYSKSVESIMEERKLLSKLDNP